MAQQKKPSEEVFGVPNMAIEAGIKRAERVSVVFGE